jgi:hypothetical protein
MTGHPELVEGSADYYETVNIELRKSNATIKAKKKEVPIG